MFIPKANQESLFEAAKPLSKVLIFMYYQLIIVMNRPILGISHHIGRVNNTSEVRHQTDSKYIIYRLDSLIIVGDG
jgi:hypothetical protein